MPAKRVFATESNDKIVKTASLKLPIVGNRENITNEGSEDFTSLEKLGWN